MRSSVQIIDYVVLVCYLLLMAGVGAFFMRFMRVGTDFLKEYIELKHMEWVEYQRHVSDWEIQRYLEFY